MVPLLATFLKLAEDASLFTAKFDRFGHLPGGLARFVPCQLQRISVGMGTQYGHGLTPKLRESGDLFVIEAFWGCLGTPMEL